MFFALLLMETSISQNANLILSVKEEALGSGLFEAFLESAPQFILQCSIILKTGNMSKFFYLYYHVCVKILGRVLSHYLNITFNIF